MFCALFLILFMQVLSFYIQRTTALCTADIPNCRVSGSTALYCTPIVPSVPQFFGMNISGCTVFGLQNEWALSLMPKETFTRFRGVQAIHLNKGGLSYLPCDLFYHMKDDLRSVYLSYNHFETIQNCTFRNLEHLETLDLTNNRVSKLDDFLFYTLPSLQRIDMGHNTISEISPRVFQAVNRSSLENVNLSFNKISVIEGGVFTNLKLKILELSDNGLKHIHKEFISTSRRTIQTLNLRRNSLTDELWGALEGLINLKTMYLDGNLLTTVKPDVFNHLSNIQYIVLSKNQIQEVKDVRMRSDEFVCSFIYNSSKRIYINLDRNYISSVPECMVIVPKTISLSLQSNRISYVNFNNLGKHFSNVDLAGNNVANLDKKVILDERGNIKVKNNRLGKLNGIPLSCNITIWHYSNNIVDLSNNTIKELDALTFSFLTTLYYLSSNFTLNISSNSLSKLPNITSKYKGTTWHIRRCRIANTYIFSNNYLRTFNFFESYPLCEYFLQTNNIDTTINSRYNMNLSHNQLSQIPDFDNKTACYLLLLKLDLSNNQIQNINHNFNSTSIKTPKLRELYLSHNKMKFIVPYAFNNLTNLQTLDLSVNNLQVIAKGLDMSIELGYIVVYGFKNVWFNLYVLVINSSPITHICYKKKFDNRFLKQYSIQRKRYLENKNKTTSHFKYCFQFFDKCELKVINYFIEHKLFKNSCHIHLKKKKKQKKKKTILYKS
ncbi:hypothetical protein KUTeg_007277 [Tegillarca granosa]|uniref:Uncharacterized protein n=1 Tax=Tegillarca granosa TaxID=220873 RepID=A0ABQ9FCT2_TEGGR|nr:hypothetical protein KUTeg_007277 [Tegillarca granosa]